MSTYAVGNDKWPADNNSEAIFYAVEMLQGYGAGNRVNIYREGRLYAWVQVKIGSSDKKPHMIYFTPRNKYGKPLSSARKVIIHGTRWTKTGKEVPVTCL